MVTTLCNKKTDHHRLIMILIIYAHPYPHHSHANKRMLEQAGRWKRRNTFALSPLSRFPILDVAAEQGGALSRESYRLAASDAVVQRPPYSNYGWIKSSPTAGLTVMAGTALHGKHLLWAVTTGGMQKPFYYRFTSGDLMSSLSAAKQATALYCTSNGCRRLPCTARSFAMTIPIQGAGASV
ncbi:NAD(P)H-dependent oxidoreductase [Salmonella enterica subsp. enterica]|nr:NAD(P)H-dependent oxidoreductase [Salmonella enterica subsp. enterica]